MGFEKPRPKHVDQAVKSGDHEKIAAFAKAGGERNFQKSVFKRLDEEMHRDSMHEAAQERNDAPPEDEDIKWDA